jgi:hypothetical protein
MPEDIHVPTDPGEPGDNRIPALIERLAAVQKTCVELEHEEDRLRGAIDKIAREIYRKHGIIKPHAAVEIIFNAWDSNYYFASIANDLTPYLPAESTPESW